MTEDIQTDAQTSPKLNIARRDLLKGGALVITMALQPGLLTALGSTAAEAAGRLRSLSPAQLDTWLAIAEDGSVTAYFGKMDMGQGVDTAIGQMIADELDVNLDRISVVLGDSALTADQGGASGSTALQRGGVVMQNAAAEARRVLLELAAEKLQVPLDRLTVDDGVVSVAGDPSMRTHYGELVGGRFFDVPLKWNGKYGNSLHVEGVAKPKNPSQYRVVGQPVPRRDLPGKVFAETEFAVHVTVPGMVHGRMVRPRIPGSRVVAVDESSISDIPDVKVVRRGDFVGVVAEHEWDAIQAADRLNVTWEEPETAFPTTSEELHDHIRRAPAQGEEVALDEGDVEAALSNAARVMEAEYEWPFNSHARMGPSTAVVDVRADSATVWTDSQKPYDTRKGIASLLGLPVDAVRSIWLPGAGSYGRSDAGDGAMDAAVLSQAVGRPVRMQWMRYEGFIWDPKGPATVMRLRAGLDAEGNVVAYHAHMKGLSRSDIGSRENAPSEVLAGHLLGHELKWSAGMQRPYESYGFDNKRWSAEVIAPLMERASPLRTAHLRDPMGCEVHFGTESFIDEVAAAAGVDPVEFRLRYVTDPRDRAVIEAAAKAAGWETRSSPNPNRGDGDILTGRGIAYAQRNEAVNAIVAEVEVNRRTGRVWVKRFVVAGDHGLVVNPRTIKRTIEGNIGQALSRTLFEEVKFDRREVYAADWFDYPILEMPDAPGSVEIVLIDRPELGPRGAGEPCTRVVPGAVANAVFDATGVRIRRAPLTPERVLKALEAA